MGRGETGNGDADEMGDEGNDEGKDESSCSWRGGEDD